MHAASLPVPLGPLLWYPSVCCCVVWRGVAVCSGLLVCSCVLWALLALFGSRCALVCSLLFFFGLCLFCMFAFRCEAGPLAPIYFLFVFHISCASQWHAINEFCEWVRARLESVHGRSAIAGACIDYMNLNSTTQLGQLFSGCPRSEPLEFNGVPSPLSLNVLMLGSSQTVVAMQASSQKTNS